MSEVAAPAAAPVESAATESPGNPAPNSGDIKDAAIEAMKKYKVKVDGQELEVDEGELLRGYSHQKAANKILQEGKKARKQAEEFIAMMKDEGKLFEVIQKLGHDPRKLTEQYLAKQLEEEMLDPREKEFRRAQEELKRYKAQEEQMKAEQQRRLDESLKAKYAKDYSDQFVDALKTSGLPATKPMVAEMAKYVQRAAKIGFKMTPSEAAQLVKEDVQKAVASLTGEADGDTLIKLLGEQVANKVRKWDTSRVKTPDQVLKTPEQSRNSPTRKRESEYKPMSHKEWRNLNRK